MRTRLLLLSIALPWTVVSSAAQLRSTGAQLVGGWRLVSQEERRADGAVVAVWGPHPGGRLIYEASGRLVDSRLELSTPPMLAGGRTSTLVLVWQRED